MSTTTTTVADAARRELGSFDGLLIGPQDGAYDEQRAIFNAMIDRRPALIAQPASADGVAETIAFARRHDLPLAIRGGGHNGAGLGTCDDGVLLCLSAIRVIEVDAAQRRVGVGGGATWHEVDAATHEHGLAVPCGIISTTGVGGLTLGGGLGHLTRRHGLTIDNLLAADVVLADGTRARAGADENPDLFWALRGGGGNFGVVTRFEFRAHPVKDVIVGPTFWPLEQAAEVMRWYREFMPAQPRELNGFFAFLTVPPADFLPAELHGRKICAVFWCYCEDDEQAALALLAPATEVGTPLLHGPHRAPFPVWNSLFDAVYPEGDQWYWRADFVGDLPDEAIAAHAAHAARMPTPQSTMHMYPIDGAVHDVAPDETPWSHRDVTWAEVIVGVDRDPANAGVVRDWTVGYWDATHPYSADGSAYVNFMMDEGDARVRASYGDNYARLARIKRDYDPDNVFRINQNITPATRF